jgi:hypothetical protein|tara:strand:- start:69 stop:200 length:132 start_codon:yes stop_codon:yes gene_type:complete
MRQYLRNPKLREHNQDAESQRGQKAIEHKNELEASESEEEGGE